MHTVLVRRYIALHKCKAEVFGVARRNYNMYADVRLTTAKLATKGTVLDTGAGPSVIRKAELLSALIETIRIGLSQNIAHPNAKPVLCIGHDPLEASLGPRVVTIDSIVCKRLAAPVIPGCDYCDSFGTK